MHWLQNYLSLKFLPMQRGNYNGVQIWLSVKGYFPTSMDKISGLRKDQTLLSFFVLNTT